MPLHHLVQYLQDHLYLIIIGTQAALKLTIFVRRTHVSRGVKWSDRADLLRCGEAVKIVIGVGLLADDNCAHNSNGAVREGHQGSQE